MTEVTPRDPAWMARSKIARLISYHYGEQWGQWHRATAQKMLNLWEGGQLHYVEFEDWLLGRLQRRPWGS
jgi:hypothetical protein